MPSRRLLAVWIGVGVLVVVPSAVAGQARSWVPPQPPCDIKPGHFRINSAIVDLQSAATKPNTRDRMLQAAQDVLTRSITGDQQDKNPAAWYYLGRYYVEMKDGAAPTAPSGVHPPWPPNASRTSTRTASSCGATFCRPVCAPGRKTSSIRRRHCCGRPPHSVLSTPARRWRWDRSMCPRTRSILHPPGWRRPPPPRGTTPRSPSKRRMRWEAPCGSISSDCSRTPSYSAGNGHASRATPRSARSLPTLRCWLGSKLRPPRAGHAARGLHRPISSRSAGIRAHGRSEERRVGKEWRCRGARERYKKNESG